MKPNYRRCISCRKVCPKQDFWRIVRVFPSGQVQLNEGMGRSAYICPQLNCLQAAQKKNRLGRSLHAPVPETLYQTLWQRLAICQSSTEGHSTAVSFGGQPSSELLLAAPQFLSEGNPRTYCEQDNQSNSQNQT